MDLLSVIFAACGLAALALAYGVFAGDAEWQLVSVILAAWFASSGLALGVAALASKLRYRRKFAVLGAVSNVLLVLCPWLIEWLNGA